MRRPVVRRRPIVVSLLLASLLVSTTTPAAIAQVAPPPDHERYVLPARGEVLRAYEAPRSSFGPGHRGVDLDVAVGTVVHAANAGRVRHAGVVAGITWVSIDHGDGITTSYGPLRALEVRAGGLVRRSTVLGVLAPGGHGDGGADRGLHFGARTALGYLDPLALIDDRMGRPSLVGPGGWEGSHHVVTPYVPWVGARTGGWRTAPSPAASAPGFAVPPNGNHLVLIAGLSTSSRSTLIDPADLGYPTAQTTRLSYAGRIQAGSGTDRADGSEPDVDGPDRDQHPYGVADTWAGAGPAAAHLATQLRAHAARHPGQAVDLVGHSQGGLVALRYLLEHHDPHDPTLPTVANLVTIASPVDGSDLATIARAIDRTPVVGHAVRRLQGDGRLGGDRLPLDAPAIGQLAARSDEGHGLATTWLDAVADGTAGPLAMGTRTLFLGGSSDLVVSAGRAGPPALDSWAGTRHDARAGDDRVRAGQPLFGSLPADPGFDPTLPADHVTTRVLPGGHTGVLQTEAVREQLWRFLAGEELVEAPGRLSTGPGAALADGIGTAAELLGRLGSFGW
ncbi:MAG: peptidoglycan DD-metalloendopeptidase family protein [Nitriliruptoraceae bacterium]|nr:peptidoglycan DD-metalloendopeptidase family protein [Nitriliruptoraceae bacterium]